MSIVICGGGMIGLGAGIMLARDDNHVTIIEADSVPAPTNACDAWNNWERRGVAQFRQPHNLLTRFRHVCDAELPGFTDNLVASGCVSDDHFADSCLPPAISAVAAPCSAAASRRAGSAGDSL